MFNRLAFASALVGSLFIITGCGAGLRFVNAHIVSALPDEATQSTRVSMSFEVWDGEAQLTGLSREAFTVYEDGNPATSESMNQAGTEEHRVPVVLLLDVSRSMYQANAVAALKAAADRFTSVLGQNGFAVTTYRFASQIQPMTSIAEIPDTFDEAGGERWTSLYAAINRGMNEQQNAIVVVFSDGADNYSQNHGVENLGQIEAQVLPVELGGSGSLRVVHTIGFGNVGQESDRQGVRGGDALQRLARNGSFHFAEQPGALDAVFQDVASRIRNVYVFDYYSPNRSGVHTLQLEVRTAVASAVSDPMAFAVGGGAVGVGAAPAATASGGSLSISGTPNYGAQSIAPGFTPDPIQVAVVSGGTLNVSSMGLGPACVGFATSNPDFNFTLTGTSAFLRVFVNGASQDTTLIVNAANGSWLCNDDSNGGTSPMIDIPNAGPGLYNVWVGSYAAGANAQATLNITELASQHP
jgi:serine protease Do